MPLAVTLSGTPQGRMSLHEKLFATLFSLPYGKRHENNFSKGLKPGKTRQSILPLSANLLVYRKLPILEAHHSQSNETNRNVKRIHTVFKKTYA